MNLLMPTSASKRGAPTGSGLLPPQVLKTKSEDGIPAASDLASLIGIQLGRLESSIYGDLANRLRVRYNLSANKMAIIRPLAQHLEKGLTLICQNRPEAALAHFRNVPGNISIRLGRQLDEEGRDYYAYTGRKQDRATYRLENYNHPLLPVIILPARIPQTPNEAAELLEKIGPYFRYSNKTVYTPEVRFPATTGRTAGAGLATFNRLLAIAHAEEWSHALQNILGQLAQGRPTSPLSQKLALAEILGHPLAFQKQNEKDIPLFFSEMGLVLPKALLTRYEREKLYQASLDTELRARAKTLGLDPMDLRRAGALLDKYPSTRLPARF